LAFIIQRHETLSRDDDASTTMKKKTTPASRSKPPAAPASVEEAVRLSEIRYRRLFETTHDGVLLLDPVTRQITDANPFMTQLLDYPHDQLVGKELFEIGLLEDEAASQEMFRKLKRQHELRYEDLPLESKSGRHQEVEVVANLYQENGHAVIQCNIRDITARRQTGRGSLATQRSAVFHPHRAGALRHLCRGRQVSPSAGQ
jgi:PAS domain S-box-containing protein